jgi:transposase
LDAGGTPLAKPLLDDEWWKLIAPLLPAPTPRRFRWPGRKPLAPRQALTGLLFVLKTGIPWEALPHELGGGSGMSCWRYLRAWQQAGVWQRLHEVRLAKWREADKLDWSRAVVDSSSGRAVLGGPRRGRIRRIDGSWGASTTSSQRRKGSRVPPS